MLENLMEALGDNALTLAAAIVIGIAGSTGASALITQVSESFRSKRASRRDVRVKTVEAATRARSTFLRYGDEIMSAAIDRKRDSTLMAVESALNVAAVSTGNPKTYEKAKAFIDVGLKYAGHNEETSRENFDNAYQQLMERLVKKIPG